MKVIEELRAIVAPPSEPKTIPWNDPSWQRVFAHFGTRIPTDFVQFYAVYGEGYFSSITHKMSAGISLYGGIRKGDLNRRIPERLTELRLAKERNTGSVPLPLYCEPKGLLPWGKTTNDTDLCWEVSGELVDNWPVVLLRTASRKIERYEVCMAEFLAGILGGTIDSELMPKELPGQKGAVFEVSPLGV